MSSTCVSDDVLCFVCCIYLNTKSDFDGMKINMDDRPFLSVDCALSASVFDAPKFDQCGHIIMCHNVRVIIVLNSLNRLELGSKFRKSLVRLGIALKEGILA